MNLTDSLVVVTGAGSGIGRATAAAFAKRGARLVVSDVDPARLDDVARELGGAVMLAKAVDVGDRVQVAALAAAVHAIQPAADVLVNNAGVGQEGGILDTSLDDWDFTLRVNLMGVVYGCHYFVPAMVARGRGHVVNLSSVLGYHAAPRVVAYQASKFGVLGLTLSMRAELATTGVHATAICPGMIATAIIDRTRFAGANPETARSRVAAEFHKRGLPPTAVADAIVDAVGKDVAVRPVGRDAWAAYGLRLAPRLIGDRINGYIPRQMQKARAS
jgi:NAD(P)-dependent dehydrogenase (short-subunit alcohol dehydrogenase family)